MKWNPIFNTNKNFGFVAAVNSSPAGIYLFKISNGNTRSMRVICFKLTIKTVIKI